MEIAFRVISGYIWMLEFETKISNQNRTPSKWKSNQGNENKSNHRCWVGPKLFLMRFYLNFQHRLIFHRFFPWIVFDFWRILSVAHRLQKYHILHQFSNLNSFQMNDWISTIWFDLLLNLSLNRWRILNNRILVNFRVSPMLSTYQIKSFEKFTRVCIPSSNKPETRSIIN